MLTNNELIILSYLRKNARTSVSKIASETNIPVTTVFNKLRQLEDKKIITKYTSLIDYSLLNYHVRVNFAVKADKKTKLLDFLLQHKNVNSVSKLGNGHDFYFETIFPDMAELYAFVESLEPFGIKSIQEHHIIEDIKKEELFMRGDEVIFYPEHMLENN